MPEAHPRLLLTPGPKPDESLMGYLMRLSEINGYETAGHIVSAAGISNVNNWRRARFAFSACEDMEGLRELTGLTPLSLSTLLYPPAGAGFAEDHLFFGAPVHRGAIQPQTPKVCPACLGESAYCRRIWDFKLITCCPIHQCLLADECPECGLRIRYARPSPCKCRCGFDLRGMPTRSASDAASRLSCLFYRLCGLGGTEDNSIDAQNPLAPLDLGHAATAVLFLSSQLLNRGRVMGQGLRSLYNREVHELLVQIGSIFEGWPERFFEFIKAKRERYYRPDEGRFTMDFGELYVDLFDKERLLHKELKFFSEAFARYLELQQISRHAIKKLRIKPKYLAINEAAARLDTSRLLVSRFISQGKLKTVSREGHRIPLLVEVDSVEKLKDELSRLLNFGAAAKYLGVAPFVLSGLVRAGCLTPKRGRHVDGSRLYFDREEVEGLFKGVTSRMHPLDPLNKNCPDLRLAVKRFGPMDDNLPNKIKAILAGKLFPRRKSVERRRTPVLKSMALPF
jgi:hypothetical protein